jgi:hypothetical protein
MIRRAIGIVAVLVFLAGGLTAGKMARECACCVPAESQSCCGDEDGGMLCDSFCCCTVVAVLFEEQLLRSPGLVGTIDILADSFPGLTPTPATPPPRTFS